MWDKIRIALGLMTFVGVAGFMHAAKAEYYMEFPEPPITQVVEYTSPHCYHKHTKRHHHYTYAPRKRYSHYDMTITYFVPVCPSCACAAMMNSCYQYQYNDVRLNRRAVTGGTVTYQYVPEAYYNYNDDYETYDTRTEDDDVMNDPDMNNQYNDY